MWKTKFDSILNQDYYVNTSDGSVSFDLPCEVQNPKSKPKPCQMAKPKLLSRITSKLLMIRSRSSESSICSDSVSESTTLAKPERPESKVASLYLLSIAKMPLSVDDSYMLDEPLNLNGENFESDAESVSSDESIQSFYLELLPNDIYFDYVHSIYCDNTFVEKVDDDYDKERERMELRLQILKELY